MSPTQQQLVERFLRNELSAEEATQLQQQMAQDPVFAESVRFEQYVKDGISHYRKTQLKARLDAIEVAPGWAGVGNQVLVKVLGGIALVASVGAVIYLMRPEAPAELVLTNAPVIVDAPFEVTAPALVIPDEPIEIIPPVEKQPSVTKKQHEQSGVSKISESTATSNTKQDFELSVAPPDPNEVADDEVKSNMLVRPSLGATDEVVKREPIDVKSYQRKSEELRYKYFDGKLFLYGDFKGQPYEILEINGTDKRRIYVYHDGSYFQVSLTDKVESLPPVVDQKVITELQILRAKGTSK